MNTKRSLTATNLAVYQHLNCDLYIHNVYHGAVASAANPGSGSASPSELAKAQYKRGLDWESSLYTWLDESNLLLKVPSLPSDGETLLENIFADDRKHFFVTGLTFLPPQAKLSKKFEAAGTTPLTFGLAKPDLLEIKRTTDGIEWRVIDAKASRNVKSSHHIQIYFYTLCLNHLLQPPNFRGQDTAGIWLPPKDGFHENSPEFEDIKSISMSLLAPPLDALIFRILPKVIGQPHNDVKWHLNPLCHGCKYEPDCKQKTLDNGELGNIPNVSIDDARALKELLRMSHASSRTNTNLKHLTDIEDLHNVIANRPKLEHVAKLSPSVVKKAKQVLALPKKIKSGETMQSPIVEAARSRKTQIIPRRNYTCPRQEDIAVFISIVKDPASANGGGDYFQVISYSSKSHIRIPSSIIASDVDFLPRLAKLIRTIESSGCTSQFYVWSYPEQALLQTYIINTALTSSVDDVDIRLCIGALSQGASLLQTTFQPLLLSGALMAFLGKGRKLKVEYQKCLGRLGLSIEGTVDMLKKRLEAKLKELQDDTATHVTMDDEERKQGFGQLPRVVVLKKEVERQLALPIAGYWDLPECHLELLGGSGGVCPDDEEIFSAFRKDDQSSSVDELVSKRISCMFDVLNKLRSRAVSAAGHSLFVNNAKRISTRFMDFCRQEEIRKLFFMQQFEVLAKLTELWQSRIDGCPEAPSLKYVGTKTGRQGTEHVFRIISGTVDVPAADKDRAFYDKLLVLDSLESLTDEDAADKLPVEALFDDLGVSGLVFPLNRWTKAAWLRQDKRVQQELVVADLRNVYTDPTSTGTMVALRSWGTNNTTFVQGAIYRLSPRLVDFNTTKILSALFEIDMDWEYSLEELKESRGNSYPHAFIPFVQLILNPNSLGKTDQADAFLKTENQIQSLFRQLRALKNDVAGSLVLKNSQHRATQRILTNRLSVIWGPPASQELAKPIQSRCRYSA
ncbi:hypothetical protein CPB83DRAFT_868907 [Crepidotus variabilis]|uniref:Uncharacterized protein n=1 Tax=Crepidotus variabilis TaxID=179855 RepID=A0A9P6EHG5_9AGAR|nr:hypothetical protein CPB83DRAFT_868907 [Crepidotus variabilis]